MIWCEIVVCDFYFSLQQNDVSTFKQKDDNCRDQLNVDEQKENRLLIKYRRLEKEDRQLIKCRRFEQESRHNWLVDRVFISHHDELTDFQNKKINDWLSLSLTHDYSRKLTMRQVKVKNNHRFQRRNFFFSQIHDHSRRLTIILVDSRCA